MHEDLKRFIRRRGAAIESRRELPAFDELASILLALANSGGGSLVIGVGSDGHVTGVPDLQGALDRIEDVLRLIRPSIRVERLGTKVEEKGVLIAEVLPERRVFYALEEESATLRTFRRDGQFWTVCYEGITRRLKDSKGIHYIAHLLAHPNKEFLAAELVLAIGGRRPASTTESEVESEGLDGSFSGRAFDPLLDQRARDTYTRRKEDLESELADAEKNHDLGRRSKLAEELAILNEYLAAASGLRGRVRSFPGSEEKARKSVQAAIGTTKKVIQKEHPLLHQHLAASLRTGRLCSYTPVPPVTWSL